MKIPYGRFLIPGLAVLCGIAALAVIPAVHLPRQEPGSRAEGIRAIPTPGLEALNETAPSMQEVVAKHLFIPQRKATGQNSYPDLVVRGVFLGSERSAVFSLKSNPQADLRVWAGHVDSALSQITDPRDPRRPIADFLREWNIKDINFNGVTVEHFITGETETYAVDYTPDRKVKDDAERGYGQGIISQEGAAQGTAKTAAGKTSSGPAGRPPVGTSMTSFMADRVSEMMQQMSPDQQKRFLQKIEQNSSGKDQKSSTSSKSTSQSGTKNTSGSKKSSKSK